MTLDVQNASHVAGGEVHTPAPISIEGLRLSPSFTASTQTTGDAATVLRVHQSGGRVKVFDHVRDFLPSEPTIVSSSGAQYSQPPSVTEFSSGNAVWFSLVAVQHRVSGAISLLYVPGAIAAVATAAKPTFAQIVAALGLGDDAHFAICGSVRFHRSADTTIQVKTDHEDRPAYVDVDNKTGVEADQASQASLGSVFHGFVEVSTDLTAASGEGAGNPYITGALLPNLPFGGFFGNNWQYVPAVDGAGAGATITFRPRISGTEVTGNDLTVTLATSALPAAVTAAGSFTDPTQRFTQGQTLDIKVQAVTAFTAGRGTIRIPVFAYVAE